MQNPKTLSLLAFAALAGCVPAQPIDEDPQPIINGDTNIPTDQAERMVWVIWDVAGTTNECSATLLDDTWVLTAAHCLDAYPNSPGQFSVVEKTNSNSSGTIAVSELHLSPSYRGVGVGDLALLKLATPVPLFTLGYGFQQPFYSGPDIPFGTNAIHAFGYGQHNSDPDNIDFVLRDAHLRLNTATADGYTVTPGTSATGAATMWGFGDSGGGAFIDVPNGSSTALQMIGVHSGSDANNPTGLGIDTDPRKPDNLPWLTSTVRNSINVAFAWYGYNCGASHAEGITRDLFNHCEGKTTCDYAVDYKRLGDPAPGCAKAYYVQYFCGLDASAQIAYLPAEAGFGSVAHLDCGNGPSCTPNCAGRKCGDDGCGGSCGSCSGQSICSSYQCVCVPSLCNGRCGTVSDGCGGTLSCPSCTCTPKCAGKRCGASNGCGGLCAGGYCSKAGYACTDDGNGPYCGRATPVSQFARPRRCAGGRATTTTFMFLTLCFRSPNRLTPGKIASWPTTTTYRVRATRRGGSSGCGRSWPRSRQAPAVTTPGWGARASTAPPPPVTRSATRSRRARAKPKRPWRR